MTGAFQPIRATPQPLEVAHLYEGRAFDIVYPFCRDTFGALGEDGIVPVSTWRPGVSWESGEHAEAYCDREGSCRFTVVSVHKPGRYPTRIFYTRIFTDPDGKRFGKSRLHSCGMDKFRRITRGYQFDYDVIETDHAGDEVAA